MPFKIHPFLIFTFFALFICLACNDEPLDSNIQNAVETILPDSELANLMEEVSSVGIIECVDFQYPISFTLYNANFQVLETVTIESDDALISFLQSQMDTETAAFVSLNFPVTLIYEDETSVEVTNNQDLEAALMAAEASCGISETCDLETVTEYLMACPQIPTLNAFTPSFTTFEFLENNEIFSMYELDLPHSGTWDIAEIEGEIHVVINFNGLDDFNGEWIVLECSSEELILQQGDDALVLSKQCSDDNSLYCFGSFDAQISLCDELGDGTESFDLTQVFADCMTSVNYELMYFTTLMDAETDMAPIANPSSFANTSTPQTIYVKVGYEGTVYSEVFEIDLILEDCDCNNPGTLTNDLIIYMPFSIEQAKDLISGYEVPGLSNSFVEDRSGNPTCAIAFDGTNHFSFPVSVQNQVVQGDDFSISVWFKMQNTDMADYEILFQKGSGITEGFQLSLFDLNTPVFSDATYDYGLWDNDWNGQTDVQWDNTDWHHLVVTRDSNNTIRLFRDGVMRNMDENSTFEIGDAPLDTYIIGQYFQGHLDDLRVYKRTLSPNEVTELFNLEGDCYQCF